MTSLVFTKELWNDKPALLALMREDNASADTNLAETELDAFGTVNAVITEMSATPEGSAATVMTEEGVMGKIRQLSYGNLPIQSWMNLVKFRLYLPNAHAAMAVNCLFHVCNGRVKSSTESYLTIGGLHPKKHPWPKIFFLMDLYLAGIFDEKETPQAMSQQSPTPVNTRKVDEKAIAELAKERELLDEVTEFFTHTHTHTVKHYRLNAEVADDEDIAQGGIIIANANLMQALGRTLWKASDILLKHRKDVEEKAKHLVVAAADDTVLNDLAKRKLLKVLMHDRLYQIEKIRI